MLAAFVISAGSMDAQNKFRKSNVGTKAKTEVKTETKKTEKKADQKVEAKKTEAKAESKKFGTANVTNKSSVEKKSATAGEKITSAPKKKTATAKTSVAPAAVDKSNLNGFFTNTYSDGIGGTCTHRLTVNYDPETGTVTGLHTNESGVARTYHGRVVGDKVVCYYDEDNDEFAEMKLYDANTIKLEGFTGTFKRNDGDTPTVSSSPSGYSGAAAVDRANYEAIKQYLKEKEEEQ